MQRCPRPTATHCRRCRCGRDWIWIAGNHDPALPPDLGGVVASEVCIGPIAFRHEPTGCAGEIAGHLHPKARVPTRGRTMERRCFACDGERAVMPSFGAYTGGLVSATRPLRQFLARPASWPMCSAITACMPSRRHGVIEFNCRPGQAKREPGPIRRGVSCGNARVDGFASTTTACGYGSLLSQGRQLNMPRASRLTPPSPVHSRKIPRAAPPAAASPGWRRAAPPARPRSCRSVQSRPLRSARDGRP